MSDRVVFRRCIICGIMAHPIFQVGATRAAVVLHNENLGTKPLCGRCNTALKEQKASRGRPRSYPRIGNSPYSRQTTSAGSPARPITSPPPAGRSPASQEMGEIVLRHSNEGKVAVSLLLQLAELRPEVLEEGVMLLVGVCKADHVPWSPPQKLEDLLEFQTELLYRGSLVQIVKVRSRRAQTAFSSAVRSFMLHFCCGGTEEDVDVAVVMPSGGPTTTPAPTGGSFGGGGPTTTPAPTGGSFGGGWSPATTVDVPGGSPTGASGSGGGWSVQIACQNFNIPAEYAGWPSLPVGLISGPTTTPAPTGGNFGGGASVPVALPGRPPATGARDYRGGPEAAQAGQPTYSGAVAAPVSCSGTEDSVSSVIGSDYTPTTTTWGVTQASHDTLEMWVEVPLDDPTTPRVVRVKDQKGVLVLNGLKALVRACRLAERRR